MASSLKINERSDSPSPPSPAVVISRPRTVKGEHHSHASIMDAQELRGGIQGLEILRAQNTQLQNENESLKRNLTQCERDRANDVAYMRQLLGRRLCRSHAQSFKLRQLLIRLHSQVLDIAAALHKEQREAELAESSALSVQSGDGGHQDLEDDSDQRAVFLASLVHLRPATVGKALTENFDRLSEAMQDVLRRCPRYRAEFSNCFNRNIDLKNALMTAEGKYERIRGKAEQTEQIVEGYAEESAQLRKENEQLTLAISKIQSEERKRRQKENSAFIKERTALYAKVLSDKESPMHPSQLAKVGKTGINLLTYEPKSPTHGRAQSQSFVTPGGFEADEKTQAQRDRELQAKAQHAYYLERRAAQAEAQQEDANYVAEDSVPSSQSHSHSTSLTFADASTAFNTEQQQATTGNEEKDANAAWLPALSSSHQQQSRKRPSGPTAHSSNASSNSKEKRMAGSPSLAAIKRVRSPTHFNSDSNNAPAASSPTEPKLLSRSKSVAATSSSVLRESPPIVATQSPSFNAAQRTYAASFVGAAAVPVDPSKWVDNWTMKSASVTAATTSNEDGSDKFTSPKPKRSQLAPLESGSEKNSPSSGSKEASSSESAPADPSAPAAAAASSGKPRSRKKKPAKKWEPIASPADALKSREKEQRSTASESSLTTTKARKDGTGSILASLDNFSGPSTSHMSTGEWVQALLADVSGSNGAVQIASRETVVTTSVTSSSALRFSPTPSSSTFTYKSKHAKKPSTSSSSSSASALLLQEKTKRERGAGINDVPEMTYARQIPISPRLEGGFF